MRCKSIAVMTFLQMRPRPGPLEPPTADSGTAERRTTRSDDDSEFDSTDSDSDSGASSSDRESSSVGEKPLHDCLERLGEVLCAMESLERVLARPGFEDALLKVLP